MSVKKIVIPTDLTTQSLNLIKYGLEVMQGQTCQIILLQLIPLPDSITDLIMLPREEDKLANIHTPFQKALDRIRKSYAVEISKLDVVPLYGDSTVKIRDFVQDNNIDLILCPVKDSKSSVPNGVELFSSLVTAVSCPVLYIPDDTEASRFRKIAYVLDTDDTYTLLVDELLLNLTSGKDYYVTFLVIFKPGTDILKLEYVLKKVYLNKELKEKNCSVHLIQENDFRGGVYTFVDEFKVDLLVAGRKKKLFSNFFHKKRISSDVAKQTRVPFLTIA
ncbi:universal stress protein [Adhaeribacter radiodurans]|uniref:Universal stress protein n=1 Tax=Adhaeribacter radiodurans TaxID=2745197 RepID=A0A7L7L9V1_9BACT|nr:universal stress protein [Adhaeribacter radiodurans]QMU29507.1 universal stress protein [Adhaeribacter radiodurans]